jgi:glycosyltransferase involved in cell wall biosynthesis
MSLAEEESLHISQSQMGKPGMGCRMSELPSLAQVAVIIPCYRCAGTIERAVASVADQSLKPVQVILVDDCSGDETLQELVALQTKYGTDWIQVIALEKNLGAASARNAGWRAASQPYVAFLDADDAWHPHKIEIQLKWMLQHPEVALTGHACRLKPDVTACKDNLAHDVISMTAGFKSVDRWALLKSNPFPTRSVMVRSDLPHRFHPGKRYSEDYLLWCEMLLDGYAGYRSPLPLAFFFKASYGESGLSSNLWAMEKGELDTYRKLFRAGRIGGLLFPALCFWSVAKYARRLISARLLRLVRRSTA